MSRLDSFIRRLSAQRACLDYAAALIANISGPVLELGLGNGRTYDHLRARLPGRDIFVFERQVTAPPESTPDEAHLLLGDFRETLLAAPARIGAKAALAHCDIGSGDETASARLAATIAPLLEKLMVSGGVVLGDQQMDRPGWTRLSLPPSVAEGRYNLYRVVPPALR